MKKRLLIAYTIPTRNAWGNIEINRGAEIDDFDDLMSLRKAIAADGPNGQSGVKPEHIIIMNIIPLPIRWPS